MHAITESDVSAPSKSPIYHELTSVQGSQLSSHNLQEHTMHKRDTLALLEHLSQAVLYHNPGTSAEQLDTDIILCSRLLISAIYIYSELISVVLNTLKALNCSLIWGGS